MTLIMRTALSGASWLEYRTNAALHLLNTSIKRSDEWTAHGRKERKGEQMVISKGKRPD